MALIIGTVELVFVLGDRAGNHGWASGSHRTADLNNAGYAVTAMFILAWALALGICKYARIEEKWAPVPRQDLFERKART